MLKGVLPIRTVTDIASTWLVLGKVFTRDGEKDSQIYNATPPLFLLKSLWKMVNPVFRFSLLYFDFRIMNITI